MTHLNLKTISALETQLSNPAHFGVNNPPESFSPFLKMEQVKITPLGNGYSQIAGSVEEQIFFTVFSEVTALAAANVLQFVGHGTATKKVIDFRGMLEAKITLENISKDYPVNFHVVSGEGARDDSFGLGNGDVIFKNNPTTPIDIEKFPKFKKRILELGLNPKDFNGKLPYQVELNIDVIDGTTFTSKGADRGTSVCTFAFVEPNTSYQPALMPVPDVMQAYFMGVAKGLKGVNTSPYQTTAEFVKQIAIAKLKKEDAAFEKLLTEDPYKASRKIKAKIKDDVRIVVMNRPQNEYLIKELKEAGVHVLLKEDAQRGKTKGKDYSLLMGNVSMIGDGSISALFEADAFMGTSGTVESIQMAHSAENASILILDREKMKSRSLPDLIADFKKFQDQPTDENLATIYSSAAIKEFAALGLNTPQEFAKELKRPDLIRAKTVMTFFSAITPLTGKHGAKYPGVPHNPEAYFGIHGMEGVTIDSDSLRGNVSTVGISSAGSAFLINAKYSTRASFYLKANKQLREVYNNKNISLPSIPALEQIQFELGRNYKELILSLLRLGLLQEATHALKKFEGHTEILINLRQKKSFGNWAQHFKEYQFALGLLRGSVTQKKLSRQFKWLKAAKLKLEETLKLYEIQQFKNYRLEIETLLADVKEEIQSLEKKFKQP